MKPRLRVLVRTEFGVRISANDEEGCKVLIQLQKEHNKTVYEWVRRTTKNWHPYIIDFALNDYPL